MHVVYDPDVEQWDLFFQNQIGGSQYFEGVAYRRATPQIGAGLGAAFASFGRFLMPLIKKFGPIIAEESLAMGSRLIPQLEENGLFKEKLKNEAHQSLKNVTAKIQNRFQQGGRRRRIPNLSHSLVGRRKKVVAPLFSSKTSIDPFDQ